MAVMYGLFSMRPTVTDGSILSTLGREIDAPGVDEVVLNDPNLVLRRRAPAQRTADVVTGVTLDGVCVAIVGRPLMRDNVSLDIAWLGWSELAKRFRELDGYWLAFAYDKKDGSLEVVCDFLGVAWLYWSRVPGGVAFSSDFGALARCLPASPRLNDDACLLSLTLTYPVGGSTSYKDIRVVSPGWSLQFRGGRITEKRLSLPEYGDRWAGASRVEKFDALDHALDASYQAWSSSGIPVPWTVALSSGNDSRYALGLLLKHGQHPSCATFGLSGSADVNGAVAICHREQLRHDFFPTNRQTSWEAWSNAVQRLGAVSGFQYVAGWGHDWRRTLARLGGQVVLGYLGDALSGRHLVDKHGGDWLANWEAWSLDEREDRSWTGSDMLRPEARKRARAIVRAALLQECESVPFAFEHQRALHLDLFCRQSRATAAQVNFLTDEIPIAPLFYTRRMIGFWSNLSYEDLNRQTLYLDYARARYPKLFAPPRRPSVARRARGALANLLVELSPSLKPYLTPPEIDTRALIAQHLDRARMLIRNSGDAVGHIVDLDALNRWVDRFSTRESLNAQGLQRFWNLLLLVDAGARSRGR
jgi:hypothetical protein